MADQSRFNRDYEFSVQVSGSQAVTIIPPMHIAFNGEKSYQGGLNRMTIKIYNLKEKNRLALVKDSEQNKIIPAALSVGYANGKQIVFKGTVHVGKNYREGADLVTELECYDGGYDFINSFTAKTIKGDAVSAILDDMPNTKKGKITEQQQLVRPKVIIGQSVKFLDNILGYDQSWFIDNEQLYIMKQDEVVSSYIPDVKASTGLLNTPTREYSKITFDTLMNPELRIKGLCNLISVNAPHLNGIYQIQSVSYDGDNYGSSWKQTITAILSNNYTVL